MYSSLFLLFIFFCNVYGDFMFLYTPAKPTDMKDLLNLLILKADIIFTALHMTEHILIQLDVVPDNQVLAAITLLVNAKFPLVHCLKAHTL